MAATEKVRSPVRRQGIDALRGAALLGMMAYHLTWDLAALGWPVTHPATSPGWVAFGDLIAAVFLGLSGVSLVLARPKGLGFAARRLALLAAAALVVTAASFRIDPDAPILFGILHCIAITNALALMTLRWPPSLRLGLATAAAAAPSLMTAPRFDGLFGEALGLSATVPRTLDYRPLLPWLAVVVVGTVIGDWLLRRRALATMPAGRRIGRALAWTGRRSLLIYLIHQPVFYAILLLLGGAVDQPFAGADPFGRQCQADCVAAGAATRLCETACACQERVLAVDAHSGSPRLTPEHLTAIESICRRGGR